MFYVKYKVDGKPGERIAGPYSAEEAEYHRKDIAGYDFVLYAVIVSIASDAAEEIMRAFQ